MASAKDYESKGIEPWFETMRPVVKNLTRYAGIVCWNLGDLYATGTQFIEPTNFYSSPAFRGAGLPPNLDSHLEKAGTKLRRRPLPSGDEQAGAAVRIHLRVQQKWRCGVQRSGIHVAVGHTPGHAYRFVKRLTKEERKNWGYAGIWEMNTVRANKVTRQCTRLELPWRCIKMHSDRGDIVLEPFSGSGTTIIACEQLERVCYAMEKSPEYCDLAVKRWEQFTGQKAERITSHADAE